ncbi:16S rRNA (uracil(1498)-N(3))-methyltransferase [Candidatus Parcubacteria bacterium]|nr:16S rRNA (uracil(1498)-N(3))-methyltransferase [Candidatus Parcubacteria bacterium]
MKIHRFFSPSTEMTDKIIISDKELVHQMHNVLKLQIGELVELFDGSGGAFLGEITEISKKSVALDKREEKSMEDARKNIFAYIPLLKRSNTELMVQKLTELGIKNIILIKTDRTIKSDANLDRLNKISIEATEQSGQYFLTNINEPIKLKDALDKASHTDVYIMDMSNSYFRGEDKIYPLSFFVGPEGGWTDEERELFKASSAKIVSLADTILRGETASIVAAYESLG